MPKDKDGVFIPDAVARKEAEEEAALEAHEAAQHKAQQDAAGVPEQTGSDQVPPATAQPEQSPAPPPAAEPQAPSSDVASRVTGLEQKLAQAEQRYRAADGLLKTQGPRMAKQVRAQRDRIRELEAEIEQARQASLNTVPNELRYLTDEEREVFRESDQLPPEVRMMRGIVEGSVSQLQQKLSALETHMAAGSAVDVERVFAEKVEQLHPNSFQVIDTLEYLQWSQQPDPISDDGSTYDESVQQAQDSRDVYAFVRLIEKFESDLRAVRGASAPESTALNRQLRPDTGEAVPASRPTEAGRTVKEYNLSEVQAFQARMAAKEPRQGLTDAEKEQLAEFEVAIDEGRIKVPKRA